MKYSVCRVEFLEERTLLSVTSLETDWAFDQTEDDLYPAMMADCLDSSSPVEELTESVLAYSRDLAASPVNLSEDAPGRYSNSDIMIGNVFVQVVLLESNGQIDESTEDWSSARIEVVKSKISEGLKWWEDTFDKYYPDSPVDLNFQIDFTYADTPFQTSYEPINHSSTDDYLWVSEFLVSQGYAGGSSRGTVNTSLRDYNYDMRLANNCDWSYTIFVADSLVDPDGKFSNSYFAYAWISGPRLQLTYDNNGWGIQDMSIVVAHESGHIFCALDEYDVSSSYSSGNASWQETGGYYGVQNLNAWDSPYGQTDSIMAGSSLQENAWKNHISSESSLQMIGWRDSDGNGLIDYLDQPLVLTNTNGSWNAETGVFSFSGQSAVTCMKNQRKIYDHTLNTVDVLRYQIDGGEWQTAQTWSNTSRVKMNAEILLESAEGVHTITFQTLCTRTGVTSEELTYTVGFEVLTTPTLSVETNGSKAVLVTVGEVEHATGYLLQYSTSEDFSNALTKKVSSGTTKITGLTPSAVYYFRVAATGTENYGDSDFTETLTAQTDEPDPLTISVNGKKITVTWIDENSVPDSIRYRVSGPSRWTTKKMKAGVTSFTFTGAVGKDYEIQILLDQKETNVLQGTAVLLDKPKLKADKLYLKDDTFQVNVTNYTAKNLAANATQAILAINGVETTVDIQNQQGSAVLTNGGKVTFENGLFTFTEMNSSTAYKVQVSFADDVSVSTASLKLSVKTLRTCYQTPTLISVTGTSDSTITATWTTSYGKNSSFAAEKYTVQYSLDGKKWTTATTRATGTSWTIKRLKGGNNYKIRVFATRSKQFESSLVSNELETELLALPKTAVDKKSMTSNSFKLNVTNYADTNLMKATVLNVMSDKYNIVAINLTDGRGAATFTGGMSVTFVNGSLTFANAPGKTTQKIQVRFTDGVCTTAWNKAVSVKTK
ncbi:MAG: fibronectin type III domain-containing protein [Thermoguttaceae bacterium]|nr:fibronectin type III domain-containing protein [Thermoguttaceae bacterium]